MKKIFFLLIFVTSVFCNDKTFSSGNKIDNIKQNQKAGLKKISATSDSILMDFENTVQKALVNSKIHQNTTDFDNIEKKLIQLENKKNNNIITYWLAYTYYYHSITSLINNNKKESQKTINKGINLLNELAKKISDHYVLLALMQSYSIQYSSGMAVIDISNKVKENGQKAVDLDDKNLRAYYTLAVNDFYTPEQYGGGKLTEKYLKKALGCPNQTTINPYLPSWGRNSAYELLIRYYIRVNNMPSAKQYFKEAIALFPNDYLLKQLAPKLKD